MENICQRIHNLTDLSKVLPWQGQGLFQGYILLWAEDQATAVLSMSGQFPHARFPVGNFIWFPV